MEHAPAQEYSNVRSGVAALPDDQAGLPRAREALECAPVAGKHVPVLGRRQQPIKAGRQVLSRQFEPHVSGEVKAVVAPPVEAPMKERIDAPDHWTNPRNIGNLSSR